MEDQKKEQNYFIMSFEDGEDKTSVSIPSNQVHTLAKLYYEFCKSSGLDATITDNFTEVKETKDVEQSK